MRKVLVVLVLCGVAVATTARDYYNEIYKAGGLDRMADGYACFPDDDNGSFFIFGQSEVVKEFLKTEGQYAKLSKAERAQLDKGFIYQRAYYKGIPREPLYFDKDGESYLYEAEMKDDKTTVLKIRYTFNWATLRYEHTVGFYKHGSAMPVTEQRRYGRCELVKTDVKQTGN
jgi:hypothetical protein